MADNCCGLRRAPVQQLSTTVCPGGEEADRPTGRLEHTFALRLDQGTEGPSRRWSSTARGSHATPWCAGERLQRRRRPRRAQPMKSLCRQAAAPQKGTGKFRRSLIRRTTLHPSSSSSRSPIFLHWMAPSGVETSSEITNGKDGNPSEMQSQVSPLSCGLLASGVNPGASGRSRRGNRWQWPHSDRRARACSFHPRSRRSTRSRTSGTQFSGKHSGGRSLCC